MASVFHQLRGSVNPRAIILHRLSIASEDAGTWLAAAQHCPRRLTEIRNPELSGLAVKMWKVPSAEQLLLLWPPLIYIILHNSQCFSPCCSIWPSGAIIFCWYSTGLSRISSLASLISGHAFRPFCSILPPWFGFAQSGWVWAHGKTRLKSTLLPPGSCSSSLTFVPRSLLVLNLPLD